MCVSIYLVRLIASQRRIVVRAIRNHDPQAEIYLFGSRINDEARGGVISTCWWSRSRSTSWPSWTYSASSSSARRQAHRPGSDTWPDPTIHVYRSSGRDSLMKPEKLVLLEDALWVLEKATEHLGYSMDRVQALKDKSRWTPEELERFESLASRFSRLADLHRV